MEDKKRTYAERCASPSRANPPPKRQFLTQSSGNAGFGTNGLSTSTIYNTGYFDAPVNIDINDPKSLEKFQKEAIFCRMQEYKREHERAAKFIETLERTEQDCEAELSAVNIYWEQLLNGLRLLVSRMDEDGSLSKIIPDPEEDGIFTDLIKAELRKKCSYTLDAYKKLVEKMAAWLDERNALIRTLQKEDDPVLRENKMIRLLNKEVEKLGQLNNRLSEELIELKTETSMWSQRMSIQALEDELQKVKNRLSETINCWDNAKSELLRTEKKFEKFRIQHANCSGDAPTTPGTNGIQQGGCNDSADGRDVIHYRTVADSRFKEIEDLNAALVKAEQEKDSLTLQLKNMPEDRVTETHVFKDLQVQFSQARGAAEHFRTMVENLTREIEDLRGSRRAFRSQEENEANSRVNDIMTEMRSLETDLNRIRTQRDEIQHELEIVTATRASEFQQVTMLRKLANDRKQAIKVLQDEVRRLKLMIYAETRNQKAVEFYSSDPPDMGDDISIGKINEELSYVAELEERLKQSDEEREILERQLEACRDARSDVKDVQSIRESEYRLRKEVDTLKRRLDEYDKKYGIKDPGDDPLHILSAKIAEKDKLIEELQEKCQTSQAHARILEREVDTLVDQVSKQEEEHSRKVWDTIKAEDTILRLTDAKTRAEQKLHNVYKENISLKKQVAEFGKVQLKAEETRRQFEYKNVNLNQQLQNQEKELAAANAALQIHKIKLAEMTEEVNRMKETLSKGESKYNELANMLKTKTAQIVEENKLRRRAEEEMLVYKNKAQTKKSTLSAGLEAEVNAYK
ncbi:532_t:CDS:10, partial [Paraglomus brasilianum]